MTDKHEMTNTEILQIALANCEKVRVILGECSGFINEVSDTGFIGDEEYERLLRAIRRMHQIIDLVKERSK